MILVLKDVLSEPYDYSKSMTRGIVMGILLASRGRMPSEIK